MCASFAMLQTLGDDAEGENLGLGHRLVGSCAVRKDARQLRHFCQPSPIFLTLTFNAEVHGDLLRSIVPILPVETNRCRVDGCYDWVAPGEGGISDFSTLTPQFTPTSASQWSIGF
jgi:hypothetical protein